MESPYRDIADVTPIRALHQVRGLSFTPDRLEERRKTLGASEIPAVAGLHRHRTALDVYLEKTGAVAPFEGNTFTEWGLRLETVIAEKYADSMGVELELCETRICDAEPWMSATPDRLVRSPDEAPRGLEIKNKSARQAVYWGESGTDQVPHDVAAQAHWGMMVLELRRWDVAVLFGGNEYRDYRLHYDAEIAERLQETGWDFWFNHVQKGIQPPIDGSQAAAEYLKARFASHSDVIREATREQDAWIHDLGAVREAQKKLEAAEALLVNRLKEAIGDAAGIIGRSGRCTWKAPRPSAIVDWKGIVEAIRPDASIIEQFTSERPNSRRFLAKFVEG